ncbi:catechol 1,2-dioxygenase [Pseudonocardiaceae bacterium YIM PH 21723]|nr:catechol 1,2-dioxygenase [Pseudonocardiaceae bacterium YIM PH 21723]
MGQIVGAGLVSHAPVLMFPEKSRIAANGGQDFTLATGLLQLREEIFDAVEYDTVIVFDSHWATTIGTVVTSADRRNGLFTSGEMPTAISQLAYDLPGDRELAEVIAGRGEWITPVDDPILPIHYATLIPWTYLGSPDKSWISVSVCRTAEPDDFLSVGTAIGDAVALTDRKVMLVASGGLSHTFWPLREVRSRMAGDPKNIVSEQHRAADLERIEWMVGGDHAKIIDSMDAFAEFDPQAGFGHYLMLAGALGGRSANARGRQYGDYENGIGTGQAHVWFEVSR